MQAFALSSEILLSDLLLDVIEYPDLFERFVRALRIGRL